MFAFIVKHLGIWLVSWMCEAVGVSRNGLHLFHLDFLPTFFDLPSLSILDVLTVIGLFLTVLGTAFVNYAYAASRAAGLFRNPGAVRILNRTSGTLLISAGATVLLKLS